MAKVKIITAAEAAAQVPDGAVINLSLIHI